MKAKLLNVIELGKLIRLVEENGANNQYSKELIQYLDMLHNKVRTLEMHMEQIHGISVKFI